MTAENSDALIGKRVVQIVGHLLFIDLVLQTIYVHFQIQDAHLELNMQVDSRGFRKPQKYFEGFGISFRLIG